MDSVVIAFSHLPRDDRGNKPCDEKNPNIITFSHLASFDRANKPSNEKILNWSDSDQLHFHTCTPAINCARNDAMKKKHLIDLIGTSQTCTYIPFSSLSGKYLFQHY